MMRDMCYSSGILKEALFLIMLLCKTCKALDGNQNCSSLCGDHNIRSPLRLKDFPEKCGDHRYNLSCEQNQLVMYWESVRYRVLSINYENRTIRVRDANIEELDSSSLPEYSLTAYNFSGYYSYTSGIEVRYENGTWLTNGLNPNMMMIFVRCERPLDSPGFVDTAPCFRTSNGSATSSSLSSSYSYVNVGSETLWDLGLDDGCGIQLIYMTSRRLAPKNSQSWSCTDIHNMLLGGFELYWLNSVCPNGVYTIRYQKGNKQHHCRSLVRMNIFQIILWFIRVITAGISTLLVFYTGAKFVLGAPFVIALLIYKWRRRHLSMYESIEDFLQSDDNNIMPLRYSYRDIKRMTKGFKVRLGKGGYGSVFRGYLRSGRDVAVKMLDKANTNGQDVINEVATLGRIHHVNVVQLIGYCVEGSRRAVIYEFMQNGSLDKYILSKPNHNAQSLDLHQLYVISLGVARGIEYLHKGCDMQILHFDIKPHNILLDGNFIPKVSDFGLAKLYPINDSIVSLTAARGTIGYMAPELFYKNIGGVSYKADVYSFGMLLMEMAGRRKNLNVLAEQSSQFYFPFWAYDQLNEGNEINIADATEEEMKVTRKMMIVGLWCIQTRPSDRPSMKKVVEMLEGDEQNLELPHQKPSFYVQDLPEVDDNNHSSSMITSSELGECSSIDQIVEILEGEEQELVLPQKPFPCTQGSPTIGVSDHLSSTSPSSSDTSMYNAKETTLFLPKEDERSL